MIQKPLLLVQVGPIHLFWTTGVYYLWELKDKYRFIICADTDYLNSNKFLNYIKNLDVQYIHYAKKVKGFNLVSNLLNEYNDILLKFKPKKILIHNTSFIDNQCLIEAAKLSLNKIEIYIFQNGKMDIEIEKVKLNIYSTVASVLSHKYKILSKIPKIAFFLSILKQSLSYYYYFKFIPLILKRKTFKPPYNIYVRKKNEIESEKYNKFVKKYFIYLKEEIKALEIGGVKNYQIINHPLITCGEEVNEVLYGKIKLKDQILITPSYGNVELQISKGKSEDEIAGFIGNKYVEVISILLRKFPNYLVKFKLHPGSPNNNIWKNILKIISNKINNVEVINQSVTAEELIIASKIVVSDVSTTLWWTTFLKDKVSISLNIFNFDNGSEMKHYIPEIHYIDKLEKLENINFSLKSNLQKKSYLIDFL